MNSDPSKTEQAAETRPTARPDQPVHSPASADLPLVDRLFVEEDIPAEIVPAITAQLLEKEAIFVLFRLNSTHSFRTSRGRPENAPFWMAMTGGRLFLVAVSADGQTYCDAFGQQTMVEYRGGLARDEIRIADRTIVTGILEGKRRLFKEALRLFPLPEYEKYLYLAEAYLKKEDYAPAIPLLRKSVAAEPSIKASLLLVHALSRVSTTEKAIAALQAACEFAAPPAVFSELQRLFPDQLALFLYLAVICEKNRQWDTCLAIYQTLLRKTPDFDLYFLKLGEMYHVRQDYPAALEHYRKFIKLRTESDKFLDGDFISWELADPKIFGADPDIIKAFFELGRIYETELRDFPEAFAAYLALLRHAPFYPEAYRHFWRVSQELGKAPESAFRMPPIHLAAFWQIYQLLDPAGYAAHVRPAIAPAAPKHWPTAYRKMNDVDHELLTHPGEREYWRRIQHWLTSLVFAEEDEQGIEQYCEQVSAANYPKLFRLIERVARLLTIDAPQCFISRGKIGISVKNKEQPFIFIGSEHLNEENERYLTEPELLFTLATQAEHIKSGHILITNTELWKSLGTASFEGFLAALQYLPAGSFIGKVTHKFATEGLKRVYKMTKYASVQKILRFFDRKGSERIAEELAEQEENHLEAAPNGRAKAAKPSEPDSLLKEQIVDFARHAVYTADRVGLLACDDLAAACAAIFKLAGDGYSDLAAVQTAGVLQVFGKKDKRGNFLDFEYAKRFRELFAFAVSEEYHRLHAKFVVFAAEDEDADDAAALAAAVERKNLLDKLHLLELSRRKDLLTLEEFLHKQQNLLRDAGVLLPEDEIFVERSQQACRDGVLTHAELRTKIIQLLDGRWGDGEMGR